MQKESDETSESEIEDDDDEEDFDVQVNLESNLQSVCRFPEELRSTHFIAIRLVLKKINHLLKIDIKYFFFRVTNPEIIKKAKSIQESIVQQEEALNDCCMGIGLFHVTLYMLRLEPEGSFELIRALEEIKPKLSELCQDLKLKISGLDTFGQRVLYGKVHPEPEANFWQLAR